MKITNRIWGAGCVVATAAIVAGGLLLGVQPQLAHADEANAAAANTEAQVAAAQGKVAALSKVAASQAELEAKATALDKAVPTALQANTFIRRVNTVAALDVVDVQSIAVGSATAYTVPQGAGAAAASAAAAAAPAATPTPSSTPSATVAASVPVVAAPVLAATDPLITGQDFTVIPMTIVVKGTSAAGLQFIKDLQRDERLYLISDFTTSTDSENASNVVFTLTGSIYALKA